MEINQRAKGRREGLDAVKAQPLPEFKAVWHKMLSIETDLSRRLSEGGDPKRLQEIASEKVSLLSTEVFQAAQSRAQSIARQLAAVREREASRFTSGLDRVAAMMEASLTIGALREHDLDALATDIHERRAYPASKYEVLEVVRRLGPDSPIGAKLAVELREQDPARWCADGAELARAFERQTRNFHAIGFQAEDGSVLFEQVDNLFALETESAAEVAAREFAAQGAIMPTAS